MSYQKEYTKELQSLFATRTKWLYELVGIKSKGKKKIFNKKFLKREIAKLSNIIIGLKTRKYFLRAVKEHTIKRKYYHNKGHGYYNRRDKFKNWYENIIDYKYIIYIFWKNTKCLYVGRTGIGGSRPTKHLGTHRTQGWTRVTIYQVSSRSYLSQIECLAYHLYDPVHGLIIPSRTKWSKPCPLCKDLKDLKAEIYDIF